MKKTFWRLLSKIGWHLNNTQRKRLDQVQQDLESLHHLPELDLSYIPWTEAALQPAGVRALLNEVIIHGRQSILEFGSGISTLYLADHFDGQGEGQIISIEEDEKWAAIVEDYLDELNLSKERFQILRAPLKPFDGSERPAFWYDTEFLRSELRQKTFDIVFVDGPVSWREENEYARSPALPFAKDYLQEESVIFLDDAGWGDQKEIFQRWGNGYDLDTELVAGMGVLRPPSSNATYDII